MKNLMNQFGGAILAIILGLFSIGFLALFLNIKSF